MSEIFIGSQFPQEKTVDLETPIIIHGMEYGRDKEGKLISLNPPRVLVENIVTINGVAMVKTDDGKFIPIKKVS